MQVVHTHFIGDPFISKRQHIAEQLQLLSGRDMQYMQAGVVLLGQLHSGKRARKTCFGIAYQRMVRCIIRIRVFCFIGINYMLIFTVRGYQQLCFREYFSQCHVVVYQHIAGTGAHEYLYTANILLLRIGTQYLISIAVRYAHEERIIGHRYTCGNCVFVFQQLLCCSRWIGIGHLHK